MITPDFCNAMIARNRPMPATIAARSEGGMPATSQAQAVELAQLRERLTVTEQTAKAVEAQHIAELARMNAAIEADRARHQQESEQLRAELAEQKKANQAATAERDQVRAELATVKAKAEAADQAHQEHHKTAEREAQRAAERIAKAEADQVQANKEASTAREDAAKLRGQVEAMQTQAAELVRALSDRPAQQAEDGQPATKPAKGKKGE
jgi:chromosome segregation ATPase